MHSCKSLHKTSDIYASGCLGKVLDSLHKLAYLCWLHSSIKMFLYAFAMLMLVGVTSNPTMTAGEYKFTIMIKLASVAMTVKQPDDHKTPSASLMSLRDEIFCPCLVFVICNPTFSVIWSTPRCLWNSKLLSPRQLHNNCLMKGLRTEPLSLLLLPQMLHDLMSVSSIYCFN